MLVAPVWGGFAAALLVVVVVVVSHIQRMANFLDSGTGFWEFNYAGEACEARVY